MIFLFHSAHCFPSCIIRALCYYTGLKEPYAEYFLQITCCEKWQLVWLHANRSHLGPACQCPLSVTVNHMPNLKQLKTPQPPQPPLPPYMTVCAIPSHSQTPTPLPSPLLAHSSFHFQLMCCGQLAQWHRGRRGNHLCHLLPATRGERSHEGLTVNRRVF